MPSKAPSATALGPASGGEDSSPRTICMQDADGPHLAPARHQFTDADHGTGDVVDPHEALGPGRGGDDVGRLTVAECRRARTVEAHDGPSGQRRLDRAYSRPELVSAFHQVGPRYRVSQIEGADPAAHQRLNGAAAAQRGAQVRGEHAPVRSLAGAGTERRPRSLDLL